MSTLLLVKNTEWCRVATRFAAAHLQDLVVCTGEVGQPLPEVARDWAGEYVVSFVSPWIVPAALLARASRAALNFHPGPPEYPGIGCYNFALYDQVSSYGVTCHHMEPRVDRGALVAVSRFPVVASDSVETLKDRSMVAMLAMFFEVVEVIGAGGDLPLSAEGWTRAPYTRRELNELGRIAPDMSPDEVRRRVRAMDFPGYPGAFVELAGIRFAQQS